MANKRITDVDYVSSLNSDESFFINHNNTIKQINKSNIVFGVENGGTGVTSLEALKNALNITPQSLGITAKSIGAQAQHKAITVSLPASSWSSNTQTVTASGVTTENTVIVVAHPSYHKTYCENGVLCTEQKSNALTFSCDSVPTAEVKANVIILD